MGRNSNLYATQRFVELLSNINHQISITLNESIKYRKSYGISYLDFGKGNDSVSFITSNKIDDIQRNNPNTWNSMVWTEKRSEMKIGKMIRMFYGDDFPTNHPKGERKLRREIDIESFVNKFKAEREKNINYNRFEVVSGRDFQKWYSQDNYSRFVHNETTLGRSCLRYNESASYLNIYSKNPTIFKMLILKDDQGKLRARANIWKLDEPDGRIYMDRIYSVNDFDVELFKNYAKEQGWLHKESQTYGWNNNIIDTANGERYEWDKMIMKVFLKNAPGVDFSKYPYLDTLSIYNTEEKSLTNDGRKRVLKPHLILTDYQGSYRSEVDDRERVFSSIYNEYIIRDDAKYVEIDDTWVYQHDAVYVHNTGGKHAYVSSDKIAVSNVFKRKYFLQEVVEYSDYLRTNVHVDSVRIAFLDEEKTKEVKIHRRMIGKDFYEKDGVILKKKVKDIQEKYSRLCNEGGSSIRSLISTLDNMPLDNIKGINLRNLDDKRVIEFIEVYIAKKEDDLEQSLFSKKKAYVNSMYFTTPDSVNPTVRRRTRDNRPEADDGTRPVIESGDNPVSLDEWGSIGHGNISRLSNNTNSQFATEMDRLRHEIREELRNRDTRWSHPTTPWGTDGSQDPATPRDTDGPQDPDPQPDTTTSSPSSGVYFNVDIDDMNMHTIWNEAINRPRPNHDDDITDWE